MEQDAFPTKGNLTLSKNTLRLSRQGYELLDKKRNVLIREIMSLSEQAKDIQSRIGQIFKEAYTALMQANIEMGTQHVESFSHGIPPETSVKVHTRSIMGVEIPQTSYENTTRQIPHYGFGSTSMSLDEACFRFNEVKDLIVELATIENTASRLAENIRKTQKRANALQHVVIPKYETRVKFIQQTLEERERDEFVRLKAIKVSDI